MTHSSSLLSSMQIAHSLLLGSIRSSGPTRILVSSSIAFFDAGGALPGGGGGGGGGACCRCGRWFRWVWAPRRLLLFASRPPRLFGLKKLLTFSRTFSKTLLLSNILLSVLCVPFVCITISVVAGVTHSVENSWDCCFRGVAFPCCLCYYR